MKLEKVSAPEPLRCSLPNRRVMSKKISCAFPLDCSRSGHAGVVVCPWRPKIAPGVGLRSASSPTLDRQRDGRRCRSSRRAAARARAGPWTGARGPCGPPRGARGPRRRARTRGWACARSPPDRRTSRSESSSSASTRSPRRGTARARAARRGPRRRLRRRPRVRAPRGAGTSPERTRLRSRLRGRSATTVRSVRHGRRRPNAGRGSQRQELPRVERRPRRAPRPHDRPRVFLTRPSCRRRRASRSGRTTHRPA